MAGLIIIASYYNVKWGYLPALDPALDQWQGIRQGLPWL